MALSKSTLRLFKWLYWVIAVLAHLFIVYTIFNMGRAITAILWLLLGLGLIYVFYYVYFPAGDPGSHWPPYITACPDYLTRLAPSACVDYVGLQSPLLLKSDPANPPPPNDPRRVFNPSGSKQEKAAKAQQYGLTWEGIL